MKHVTLTVIYFYLFITTDSLVGTYKTYGLKIHVDFSNDRYSEPCDLIHLEIWVHTLSFKDKIRCLYLRSIEGLLLLNNLPTVLRESFLVFRLLVGTSFVLDPQRFSQNQCL